MYSPDPCTLSVARNALPVPPVARARPKFAYLDPPNAVDPPASTLRMRIGREVGCCSTPYSISPAHSGGPRRCTSPAAARPCAGDGNGTHARRRHAERRDDRLRVACTAEEPRAQASTRDGVRSVGLISFAKHALHPCIGDLTPCSRGLCGLRGAQQGVGVQRPRVTSRHRLGSVH